MIFVVLLVLVDLLVQLLNSLMSVVDFIPSQAYEFATQFIGLVYAWSWLVPIQTVFSILIILISIVYTEFLFHTGAFLFWLVRNTFKPSWV